MPGVTGVLQYFGRAGALEDEREMRQVLSSAITYYVRTTGNDLNNGLSPATAWLTTPHAVSWIGSNLDFNGQTVTLDIGAGTFTANLAIPALVGGGFFVLQGAGVSQTTLVDPGGNLATVQIHEFNATVISITDVTLTQTGSASCLDLITLGAEVVIGNLSGTGAVTFNCAPGARVISASNAYAKATRGTFIINSTTPNGVFAWSIQLLSQSTFIDLGNWTVNGTPVYSDGTTPAFCYATDESHYDAADSFGGYAGAVTGPRFRGTTNSDFDIPGSPPSLTWFPGSVTGILDSSSTYGGHPFAVQKAGAPAAGDLIAGAWGVFKDTNAGTVVIAYNDGGVIKTAALT